MALSRTFRRRSRRARGVARVLHLFLPSRVSVHNRPAVTCVSTVRAVSGVSPRVCMFSLALGDARRGCGTVCGQPRVAAGFFLLTSLALAFARRTHCVIERNHGRTADIHDISTDSLHLKRLSARREEKIILIISSSGAPLWSRYGTTGVESGERSHSRQWTAPVRPAVPSDSQ